MSGFSESVFVITGAGSGIGQDTARLVLRDGAIVLGIDSDADALSRIAEDAGPAFKPYVADVGDPVSVAAAAEQLGDRLNGVTGLVNCAGIGGYTGDVTSTSVEDWHRVLAVNLTGPYLVSRAVVPLMRRGACIIHVASQYALVGGAGFPAYCASKAGLLGLTRAMAVDHAPLGIRVNCVCPGPIDTPMLRRSSADAAGANREGERTAYRSLLPAPGAAHDVASVIAFLLGPAAAHMTGSIVPVDGGWSAA